MEIEIIEKEHKNKCGPCRIKSRARNQSGVVVIESISTLGMLYDPARRYLWSAIF
ncbi:hypothetical protein ACFLUO_01195 [Chloroflexota bacterium]